MNSSVSVKQVVGIAVVIAALSLGALVTEHNRKAFAGGTVPSIKLNVPEQQEIAGINHCNWFSYNAVLNYVKNIQNPTNAPKPPPIALDMAAALNSVDTQFLAKGSWSTEADFDNEDPVTLRNEIIDSLFYNRPVILGNGLYSKPTGNHPGHFYLVIGFYRDATGTARFFLRDGTGQANHDFFLPGATQAPTIHELISLGPNKQITVGGTLQQRAVMIFFKPNKTFASSLSFTP